MIHTPSYIFMILIHSTLCLPQTNLFIMPNVDFSTAQEVNGLEPSPTPELAGRSLNTNGNSLEATLEEVQNILKSSPDLPRLTKGEILDLIENITKQDMEKLRNLNKTRNGKSVLLVMPYSPKKNGETMEDLYTKKPITQLIDNDNTTFENKKDSRKKKPTFSFKKESNRIFGRNVTKLSYKMTYPTTQPTEPTSEMIRYDTTSAPTTEPAPIEVTTFRRRLRPPRTRPPTTTRPTRRRRRPNFTTTPIDTQQDQHTNSNSQMDKFLPENAIRVTRPPIYRFTRRTTTTTTEIPDLSIAESYQDNVYVDPHLLRVPSSELGHMISNFQQDELSQTGPVFKPISNQLFRDDDEKTSLQTPTTFKPLAASFIIPEGFEHIIRDLDLDSASNREKLEETIRSNTIIPRTTTTTTTPYPITPMPEFGEVADNLSPDMRNLLMTFGLIPNHGEKKVTKEEIAFNSGGIEEHPESYIGFKPLPENTVPNRDLDSLLASFGLGRSGRKSKKIQKRVDVNPGGIDLSVVPESMMSIVQNLGLSHEIIPRKNSLEEDVLPLNNSASASNEEKAEFGYENDNVSADDIEDINSLNIEYLGKNASIPEDIRLITENQNDNASILEDLTPEENSTLPETLEEQDMYKTELPLVNMIELLKMDESNTNTTNQTLPGRVDDEVNTDIESQNSNNNEVVDIETTTKTTSTSVVFNPTDQKIVEKQKEQLEKLMELIKALKQINGSATEEDFKNFDLETLREFTKVLNDSQVNPFSEHIQNEINPLHNFDDIPKVKPKRQEVTSEIPTSTEEFSTEYKNTILEESFGKIPEEEDDTPTTKKYTSGVYYMIDWNTFLEVDNTKGTHVNLRFQPKVGDPGRFYSINNN